MKKIDVIIISWHQTYLSNYAGGYIRLTEFLKRFPSTLNFILVDNCPSLYTSIVLSDKIYQYTTFPSILQSFLVKNLFILWYMLEHMSSALTLYITVTKLIKKYNPKVLYIPIGEFSQVYLVGVLLKKRFPKIHMVIDILNFGYQSKNVSHYKSLRDSGVSIFRSMIISLSIRMHLFFIKKTIQCFDFIFSVSPELVTRIKAIYKKSSIDYTPSGVNINKQQIQSDKKFLGIYVGRLTAEKGIFELIDIWRNIIKEIPHARLALVGSIDKLSLEILQGKITNLGLTEYIHVLPNVSEEEKFKILSESEIFFHLAKYEPLFPVIGILEGLSMGMPVILYSMPVVLSQHDKIKSQACMMVAKNGEKKEVLHYVLKFSKLAQEKKAIITKQAIAFASAYDWNTIAAKEFNVIKKFVRTNV